MSEQNKNRNKDKNKQNNQNKHNKLRSDVEFSRENPMNQEIKKQNC
ncbi:hypothetical protein [Virgibacillus dokdonensis]|uniref:Uncharacterized protein n=1 Tax=Virgibacillus dokdonensis TaxID=302167 RepID=A0A2K9J4Q8_9BACI|nr:hypothetical protein [Virgibacillus dokdonensis]AUJ26938.1 hypothetical protein A21D_03904 [Virgibacillus dokdonensis]